MRNVNKIIAFLLALCMAFTVVTTSAVAGFSDVSEKYSFKDAINTLASLGLILGYEDGTFRPSGTITRAEFSTIMARTLGMANIAAGASSAAIFTDMTVNGSEHWGSGYVKVAYDLGIIKGMGDGTFCPDNPITYEQAVKMIVCALGYETAAIDRGGWPNGYLAIGSDLGVTDSSTSYSDPAAGANRGVVAQLLYNSLTIPLAEKSSSGGIIAGNDTILSSKLKAVKFTNATVLNVDGIYSLDSADYNAKKGEVILMHGGTTAKYTYTGLSNADVLKDCLGYLVSGYYKVNTGDDTRTLLMLEVNSNRMTEMELTSDDIDTYDGTTLRYYTNREADDGRTKTIKISDDANFIYNGTAVEYKSMSPASKRDLSYWLDPDSENFFEGTIKLVDSTSSGEYDIITMQDFETYVVKSAVTTTSSVANNYVIYDYYISGRTLQIDVEDPGVIAHFYNVATGKEMKITELSAMDVASIAASLDGTRYEVYVSRNSIKGKVEEVSSEGEYIINGKEYEVSDYFNDVVDLGKEDIDADTEGVFYIDRNGKIAAVTVTQSATSNAIYGYLTVVAEGGVADDGTILKILNASEVGATPTRYYASPRLKINGETCTTVEEIRAALLPTASLLTSNTLGVNNTYSQPVKYVVDAEGYISNIITLATTIKEEPDNGDADDEPQRVTVMDVGYNSSSNYFKLGTQVTELKYTTSGGFQSRIAVNSSTICIIVAESRNSDTDYKVTKATNYLKSNNIYKIEAVDVSTSGLAKMILIYGASAQSGITVDSPACVIAKVSTKKSTIEDGDAVVAFDVYENGTLKSYEAEDTSSEYSSLRVGDVVRFGFNDLGQINQVNMEMDSTNLAPREYSISDIEGEPATSDSNKFKTMFGTVFAIDSSYIRVVPDRVAADGSLSLDSIVFNTNSSTKFYQVDLTGSNPRVELMSNTNAIIEYGEEANINASMVFVQTKASVPRVVVMYLYNE